MISGHKENTKRSTQGFHGVEPWTSQSPAATAGRRLERGGVTSVVLLDPIGCRYKTHPGRDWELEPYFDWRFATLHSSASYFLDASRKARGKRKERRKATTELCMSRMGKMVQGDKEGEEGMKRIEESKLHLQREK
jgi:hypothetical protein